jgi:hypothetical protein
MIKKIGIRILAFVLLLVVLNGVYNLFFYTSDLNRMCEEVVEMKQQQEVTDMFYLAESSNFSTHPEDSIQLSISQITNLFYPDLKIHAVNKPATHAGIYRHWIDQLDLSKKMPKAIIVTLNLRSFGAAWIHSRLETSLQESITLLKPYPNLFNRFLLSLNAFDNKTEKQREQLILEEWKNRELVFPFPVKYKTVRKWDDAMAQGGFVKENGSWDTDKITLACHYIKSYAFNIDEDNPRIKDFDYIADWCKTNSINLYLNLMAENVEYADSLVGKELVYLMKNNRDYLVNRYNKDNCIVVDNLELVAGKEFTDQTWTTEHYSYKGRMIIAKNLANSLKKQFSNHYKNPY